LTTKVESLPLAPIFRRLAHVAFVLLGVASVTRPLSAQLRDGLDSAGRVIVSRNEVRVYFPPLPLAVGYFPATPGARREPSWIHWVAYFDTPTRLSLRFRDSSEFVPKLPSIVRGGRLNLCHENMINQVCSSTDVSAMLENGNVVLSYRDTVEIRQAFGLHPPAVMLLVHVPSEMGQSGIFAAPVRYIDPPIVLDSAERVLVAREHRRREAILNSYSRGIAGALHGRTSSIAVGDSVDVLVQYYHCLVDLCGTYDFSDRERRDWGRWSLTDSSVATLHPLGAWGEAAGYPPNDDDRARKLVARRPGRTMLRITGVRTAADTMPSRTPLDSILEREIIVTPRSGAAQPPRAP
jgi:hypothetical protein